MEEKDYEEESINIGNKIKRLRNVRQVALSTMAEELDMSYSYLWGLENNKHSISVVNLQKLSKYFNVDLIYFFTHDEHSNIKFLSKEKREQIVTDDNIIFELITPSDSSNLQVTKIFLPEHSPAENSIHKHEKGEETIIVLEGKLHVIVEDESYDLKKGDSIFFEADREHIIFTKKQDATFFLISSPPLGKTKDIL